ncbi:MAG: short-chain dehydrogenase [Alphaproteobacteria bacterium PA4]|nr:MAG: short-chain dehydrogenase [Alphaproteobacteria bacterium PA4]
MTNINTIALVTGANRGIGRALVEALLARGARRVYAAARDIDSLGVFADPRVVPLALDVTDAAQITAAAARAADVTLVINNAGALEGGTALDADVDSLDRQLQVNVIGPARIAQAFAASLKANQGALANVLSVVGRAPMPGLAFYSVSKAAAASLTAALRGTFAGSGVSVHGIFPGPVDTDMAKDIDMDKTPPAVVAAAILDGIAAGAADIYPDAMAQMVGAGWAADPLAIERQFAA